MRRPRLSGSRRRFHRQATGSPQCGTKVPADEPKREEELSKPTGVGKAKGKKTRRGKRGGVRRRMQMEKRLFLAAIIEERLRDIRSSVEAIQTSPSNDVTVDGMIMNLAEMSMDASNVERLYDYEHYFPEQLNEVPVNNARPNVDNGRIIQHQHDGYYQTRYADSTGYAGYEQTGYDCDPGYYGYEHTGYGNGCGYDYGCDNGYCGYACADNEYSY